MFFRVFLQVLEREAIFFRKVENGMPETPSIGRRVLSDVLTRLRIEQLALHDKVVAIIKTKLLTAANPPQIQILCHKTIGDAYTQLEPFLEDTNADARALVAKQSYEAALEIARVNEVKVTDPHYLRTVLNWAVFQRRKLLREQTTTGWLFTIYADAMRTFSMVGEEPQTAAVLELIRTNLVSWMADEEPAAPLPELRRRTRSRSRSRRDSVGSHRTARSSSGDEEVGPGSGSERA
jgi:hypothetical protein